MTTTETYEQSKSRWGVSTFRLYLLMFVLSQKNQAFVVTLFVSSPTCTTVSLIFSTFVLPQTRSM